jgi:hypothetical protein
MRQKSTCKNKKTLSKISAWNTKKKTKKEPYWYDCEQHRKIKTVELSIDEDARHPDPFRKFFGTEEGKSF